MKNPARGGGRWIDVAPPRLLTWVESFAARHEEVAVTAGEQTVTFTAADGAEAECHPPFPPLLPVPQPEGLQTAVPGAAGLQPAGSGPGLAAEPATVAELARRMAEHAEADRTVGVLLVRLGGYAAGVFTGSPPRLAASKVGSRLVHGRSAAGGQSQHRFARRREKQAAEALAAAAGNASAVLARYDTKLDAVVLGGDRAAVAALRGDPRLARYFDLAAERFLTVPDPRLAVLRDTPRLFQAIRIRVTDPAHPVAGPRH